MTNGKQKIVVAITGASGSIYARQVVSLLLKCDQVAEVAIIMSENGMEVMEFENEQIVIDDPRITLFSNSDMFAPVASGSASFDAMVVVPCSMGTIGRVATGCSDSLITRAADVMLKERRKLILAVRETPLNTIHLRNMNTLSECGAIILPASPSFYRQPESIEELCLSVSERIISLLDLQLPRFEWGARE